MMKAALVFAIEDARSGSTDNLRSGISVSRMDYGNFYVWDARPGVDFSMTYAFGVELDEMTSDEIADYVLANWRPEYDIARGQKAEEALR